MSYMLDDLGFRRSITKPGVRMRAANKPAGEKYYKYILCYVDDIIFISNDARQKMGEI